LHQNFIEVYWASSGNGIPNGVAGFLASSSHVGVMFQWTNYEVGVGQYDACQPGSSGACNYVFMHIGQRSPVKLFISGVVFDDVNGNSRMDLGEGRSGVTVSGGGGLTTTTNAGGGYSLAVTAGAYTLTASGAGFPTATATATVTSYNVSVDFTGGASLGTTRAYELCDGLEPTLLGTDGPDTLVGTSGDDVIHGLDGDDLISGGGGNDVICGGGGLDTINGTAEPSRLAGADRYATGVEVSRYSHPGPANVVYLAVGTNYPDAIAAGPAAAREDAPILLVSPTGIPSTTRDELLRLSPHQIVILGGTAAIPEAVVDQVANLIPGAAIERRWGATRYETAAEISAAAFLGGVDTVFVATGADFADALIVAPIAATSASPLLLVRTNGIPEAVAAELTRLSPGRIIVVGSASAISDAVLTQLGAYAPATRVDARDRYALSATVSGLMYPAGAPLVYVATGSTFPDALTAGPATATAPGPLLLVNGSIPAVVAAELDRLHPNAIIILGGEDAVSNSIAEQLIAYLN
jgi:putative cell wall-binding protein